LFYQQYTEKLLGAMAKHTKSAEFWSKEFQEIKQAKDKLEQEAHFSKELIGSHEHSLDNLYREN